MAVELEVDNAAKCVRVREASSVSSLSAGYFGQMKKGVITLGGEEALYLIDIRNAKCRDRAGNPYSFNEVAALLSRPKQMARYLTFKDWRDRGLVARPVEEISQTYGRNALKHYPEGKFGKPGFSLSARFFQDDLMSVNDDDTSAKELYERWWLGQYGTYKAEMRGRLGKMDVYETLFLMKHAGLRLNNAKEKDVMRAAVERRPDFKSLYEVYEDWRLQGFVLKTGFKFGTHFRIYFPGATPVKGEGWMHSQHVLHVFARESQMLISEWARAIRLAHSVRKTFVLAIPGQKKKSKAAEKAIKLEDKAKALHTSLDFLLYHRKGVDIENPRSGIPRYLMLSLSEEEYLGGAQLAAAIEDCKRIGLELMLGIADRESSVTYYAVSRIDIPGSEFEYYEIEWVQP
ncbi:MAG: tRNA-intron lyase [Candidatus Micrarchaeota archaeon]|nr:tRNA-intron lyase [Candidatus Micrarchaeota archaeon]